MKKNKKQINPFSQVKIFLLQYGELKYNFSSYMNNIEINKNSIKNYMHQLYKTPLFKKFICDKPFPKELVDLKHTDTNYTSCMDFNSSIYWEANIIKLFSTQINQFEKLRREYVKNFMLGNNDIALNILNTIEDTFGQSMWLIENKMILINTTDGLVELNKYVNNITQNNKINGIIRTIIEYIFAKIDSNMDGLQYEEYILDRFQDLTKQDTPTSILDYISFKLNIMKIQQIKDYYNIIYFESNSSIIDKYLTFIKVAQQTVLNEFYDKKIIIESINILSSVITDPYLTNINFYYGISNKLPYRNFDNTVTEIIKNYSNANYKLCIDISLKLLLNRPYLIDICEIYVKALVKSNSLFKDISNKFLNLILKNMHNILVKNNKSNESYLFLKKLVYVYSSHHWSNQIFNFLQSEFNNDNNDKLHANIVIGKLNSLINTPKQYEVFHQEKQKVNYIKQLKKLYKDYNTIELLEINNKNLNKALEKLNKLNFPENRKMLYKAKYLKNNKEFKLALEIYSQIIINFNDYLDYQSALKGMLRCLIELEKYDECIKLVTSAYIENNNIHVILPIKEIIEKIKNTKINDFLSLAILYDIYVRNINVDKFIFLDLSDTYEDFLYVSNIKKPNQFDTILNKFDKNKLIYFLRYICIPNVIDTSPEFISSNELYEERIKVCQILINYDKKNYNAYSEQIKDYTKRLIVSEKMAEIDQSKIYVDIDGIKKVSENKLQESYKRYMALLSSEDFNIKQNYIEFDTEDGHKILVATNEKQIVFWKIFYEMRDMFALNSDYGLDTYLSVNIRHGTLSGMLRKPLEVEHLITLKDEQTGEYNDNQFWKEKYSVSDKNLEIIKCLNLFSKKTDSLIDLLKNHWIQISTEDELIENGLFDFIFPPEELEELEKRIHINMMYEEFVELIFNKLWDVTEEHLEYIRSSIDDILIKKYNSVFDKFQTKIAKINQNKQYRELDQSIIKARTEILNSLTSVSSWFKRSKTFNTQDYDMQLAVDISYSMIQNIYPHKKINIKYNGIFYLFKGDTLNNFIIIFYTIFDNVIKHSNLEDNHISIIVKITNNDCLIICKSKTNKNNINENNKKKISQLENLLNKKVGMEKVKKEEGSGFYKIIKILNTDLETEGKIKLYFSNEQYFNVKLLINKEGLYCENSIG